MKEDELVPVDHRTIRQDGVFDHAAYKEWERGWRNSLPRYYRTDEIAYVGSCGSGSAAAVKAFPELALCRGIVEGRGYHWWCVAPDGVIVDPTYPQFKIPPSAKEYLFLDEQTAHLLPTGKCMNCGWEVWKKAAVCSEECAEGVADDLGCTPDALPIGPPPYGEPTYIPNVWFKLGDCT